jgi:ABC-type Fe3+ transport system permease subunit
MTDQKPEKPGEPDWRYVMAREDAHREHDRIDSFSDKLNEATFKSSEAALRACLLINGGAAVSVLAFIGGLLSKGLIEDPQQLKPVADSLVPFAYGVVAAVVGMGLSYAVNFLTGLYMNSRTKIWAHPWSEPGKNTKHIGVARNSFHALAALVGVASVVFFVCGIFAVRDAVEHIPPPATHTQAPSAKPSP